MNEIMSISVKVAYALANMKPALLIQDEEFLLYDKVFICFAISHIQLTHLGGVGCFVSKSGGIKLWLILEFMLSDL